MPSSIPYLNLDREKEGKITGRENGTSTPTSTISTASPASCQHDKQSTHDNHPRSPENQILADISTGAKVGVEVGVGVGVGVGITTGVLAIGAVAAAYLLGARRGRKGEVDIGIGAGARVVDPSRELRTPMEEMSTNANILESSANGVVETKEQKVVGKPAVQGADGPGGTRPHEIFGQSFGTIKLF
ncbi:hypothetical protein K432DRAFT_386696 [Lepidopterella palustris CBS 459.81]|uniref:Uncharacterized protein n=1 Tax=Lepidopterella palustris CBS 459.81 TaxID=1314670 RepID=A0A8E2J9U9_9PEZI|nr:hypothetical protein K432DRAFT_386696 [Lepidopterella palustris CBS 459.81]